MSEYRLFVGIDWATEEHAICILDRDRKILDQRKVKHSGAGLAELTELLAKHDEGNPAQVAVGIEIPRGAVVEYLVERGYAVHSLNPKQMDRFRDRHTVAGAKDDRLDAFVIADSLRTDLHLFHKVQLDHPLVIRLRELSRTEENIQQEQVRAGNQLRELLIRYYPQALKLSPELDEPWFWDLLEKVPLPAKKLSPSKIKNILSSHRIRRLDAEAVRQVLDEPALKLAPGAAEAASEHVLLILPKLRLLHNQRKDLKQRIEALLDKMGTEGQFAEHRDVTILRSLPGVGQTVAATMFAEASQPLSERDYHALRAYGGTAPITRRSGKGKVIVMRRSCSGRLRDAIYHWSRVSTQWDPWSKAHYAELRAKGHRHGRALRGVADRLLAVLIAMLKTGTVYDPSLHQAKLQDAPAA